MDLKIIIYFFESLNFNKKNDNWIKKIFVKNLSEMDIEKLKKNFNLLKEIGIYNNEGRTYNYFKLFTSLYDKKEAIDFYYQR